MNRIFKVENLFEIPDGTSVSPFLNAKDALSGLPFDLLDGFSIAAGEIKPSVSSKIHIHPIVTQVTFVYEGRITIMMREATLKDPYAIQLETGQAVLTKPGTFFQLLNGYKQPCCVLYIVSPAYVFLMENNRVIYDDALVLNKAWLDLADTDPSRLYSAGAYQQQRTAALEKIHRLKTN